MIQCRKEVLQSIHLLKRVRQEIHMYPEIGFQTAHTWAKIKQFVPLLSDSLVKNGGIFVLKGKGKTIGIRCELDGLDMIEKGQISYRSKNNYMHACGHDGHMAIVVCLIHYYLKQEHRPTLIFIFQPAEESGAGAKVMIENGLFEKYPMDALLACHLYPHLPVAAIGSKANELMAGSSEWKCFIQGQSGHAASGQGIDSIKAMHYFLTRVYQFKANHELLHVGKIHGGEICNGIASHCYVHGTLRSFTSCLSLKQQLMMYAYETDTLFHTHTTFEWGEGYEVVRNNEYLVKCLQEVSGEDYQEMDPLFLSEDFSFYCSRVPSCFFFIGINSPSDLHDACFDFNEWDCLKGMEIFIRMIEKISESVDN